MFLHVQVLQNVMSAVGSAFAETLFMCVSSLVCSAAQEAECGMPVCCSAPDAMLIALQAAVF